MNNTLFIICLLAYFIYMCKKIRYDVHMFQLNSYRSERYIGWLQRNALKVFRVQDVLMTIPLILLAMAKYKAGFIVTIVVYLVMFLLRKTGKEKVKLNFTRRLNRLLFTIAVVYGVVIILFLLLTDWPDNLKYITLLFVTLAVLAEVSFLVVLLANIINMPLELSINRYYYNDAKKIIKSMSGLTVIGITGSYGKTSTKNVINKILSKKFDVLMPPKNYNTTMGVIKTIRMNLKATNEVFIVEMGAKQRGDIKEICDLVSPKYGVLTSIGPQHLETFKTIENVQKTKFELIEALPQDGFGFINMDDENIRSFNKPPVNIVNYGIDSKDLQFWAEDIKFSSRGSTFTVCTSDGQKREFTTKLLGKHNIYNILAGVALATKLGMTLEEISYAVMDLAPVEHRLQLKNTPAGITIIDDAYNSNPVGSKMALEVLKVMDNNKKIMITPGMIELGEKEYELNKAFGTYAADACDYIILVGNKQTKPIQDGLKEKNYPEEKLFIAKNLDEALAQMGKVAGEGSVVLFENDLPDDYNE